MIVSSVELTGLVKVQHRGDVSEHVKNNSVEPHVLSVPIHRIASDNDPVIRFPRFHPEAAAGDDVLRIRPCMPEWFNRPLMNDAEEMVGHKANEIRGRLNQRDA